MDISYSSRSSFFTACCKRIALLLFLSLYFHATGQVSFKGTVHEKSKSAGWHSVDAYMPGHIQAFQENLGQYKNPVNNWDVKYACNSGGTLVLFTEKGLIWSSAEVIHEEEGKERKGKKREEEEERETHIVYHNTVMNWEGANPHPAMEVSEETPFYFCSSNAMDVHQAINHIRGFKKLRYKDLYPGIDVEYTFHPEQGIKYVLIVKPGAVISAFSMHYSGQQGLKLDASGNLHIETAVGDILDHAPSTYSTDGQPLASSYELSGSASVHFHVERTGEDHGMLIDPWTVNPTTPPGSNDFNPTDVGMDGDNNTYILGMDFNHKMYVQKYDPTGLLKWSYTFNEYSGTDISDLAVDPAGNTYVASPYMFSNSNGKQYAMVSLNTAGARNYFYDTYNNTDVFETWVLAYSCNYSTLIQAGAYAVGKMQAAVMNPANGTIGALNTTPAVGELIAGTVAPNNLFYALAAVGSNGKNAVACFSYTGSSISYNWSADPGYNFTDFSLKMNASAVPINGIAAGCAYLYTTDGLSLDQRSLTNGSLIRRISVPGGTNSGSNINSGLAVDLSCGYVYVGSTNHVYCYDANLNLVFTYSGLPGIVADVTVDNGLVSCCGAPAGGGSPGFVAQFPAQNCGTAVSITHVDASCTGTKGSATANATFCSGPYTYLWSPGGQTSQTATGLAPGIYTVQIGTASSCATAYDTVTIKSNTVLPTSLSSSNGPSCNGSCYGSATAVPIGGTAPYVYSWTSGKGNASVATSLCAGTVYTCTITDASGCTGTQTVNLSQPSALSVASSQTNTTCNGGMNGTATAKVTGGTPGYVYSWSPAPGVGQGTDSASGLGVGTYTCAIKDTNGCVATKAVIITQPAALGSAISATQNVSCKGGSNGSATVTGSGGTPGYSFSWSPTPGAGQGTASVTGLSSGTYMCMVSDTNGCTVSDLVLITEPTALTNTFSKTTPRCNGAADGTADVVPGGGTPGYTYLWNPMPTNGQGTPHAGGLGAGTYTCTVSDTNGCSTQAIIMLGQPLPVVASSSSMPASCGLANGWLSVSPSGGDAPYTYSWSPSGGISASAINLSGGIYSCYITDANGCTGFLQDTLLNIGQPPLALVTSGGPTTFCSGDSVKLIAAGGTSYLWNTGDTTAVITVTKGGAYSVSAKNTCGVATAQITVTVDALPVPVISGNKVICAGDSALITASGGTTYLWNPTGATTPSIYIRNGGTYTVMVSNSCGTTASSFNLNVNSIACHFTSGPDTGSAPLPVNFADHSTGTPVSWSWNFGNGSTATGQNPEYVFPSSGTYTVTETVTDSFGCRSSSTTLVVIHDQASWIVVPNIFTPNGDGVNDTWQVSYQNIQDFDAKIFDRWGVELIHLTSPGESWDGRTLAGNMASDGTYYYIIMATGGDGKKYTLTGYTMLLHNK